MRLRFYVGHYFTGKEFDGDEGVGLTYFGRRYYDPEIGVWTATDPKDQLFNSYGYTAGNPINQVDPNGEWAMALFAAAQWYLGNSMSQGSFNPGKWDWSDPGLWISTVMTAFSIGMDIGNDFAQLAARNSSSKVTDASGFGNAGDAEVKPKVYGEYPNPDDPTAKMLNERTVGYANEKLKVTNTECSRYTGYEIEGKVLTPEQLTARATDPLTITRTTPPTDKNVWAVTWQASGDKATALTAAGRSTQHSGAYYDGYVWHKIKTNYFITPLNELSPLIQSQGYNIGPTFRLW